MPGADEPGGTGSARPGRRHSRRARPRSRPARLISRGSQVTMWLGLALGVAVYALFGLAPAAVQALISFTNYTALPWASTNFVGWANYTAMFTTQRPGFVQGVTATIVFVLAVTIGQNLIALLLAHRLQGEGRWAAAGRVVVFMPIALGATIVGLIWILIFDPEGGPANSFFSNFGIHSSFFGSSTWAMPLVILVQIWQNAGFSTLVFISGLRAIDPQIYEAADIDGIGSWQRLRRITWPLLAPSVTVNLLLALVGSFTLYNTIYVLTEGLFGTQTLGMLAFNAAFNSESANIGYGAAVTTTLFVATLVVAIPAMLLLRWRERRLLGVNR